LNSRGRIDGVDRHGSAATLAIAPSRRLLRSLIADRILALLLLNLTIQLFDGVATYVGLGLGVREANPLVAAAMREMGTGSGLALSKLVALLFLALLFGRRDERWVGPGLMILAIGYICLSLIPWTVLVVGPSTSAILSNLRTW
jgi:uncharacterized membrane protein